MGAHAEKKANVDVDARLEEGIKELKRRESHDHNL
jgi:hypothetical protein